MKVVCNSTPIISLATIGRIDLLSQLFGMIYIPQAVYHELKSKKAPGHQKVDAPYFHVKKIQGTPYVGFLLHDVDRVEAEALVLAKELLCYWGGFLGHHICSFRTIPMYIN